LKFTRIDEVSVSGGYVNLDLQGHRENVFWVIDGATALSSDKPDKATYEVQSIVEKIDETIKTRTDDTRVSLKNIMYEAAEEVNTLIPELHRREPWEIPSCAIAITRINEESIDYILLGDVTIVFQSDGLHVITDNSVGVLDKIAITEKYRLQVDYGFTSKEARNAITPILRENRSKMNTPNGYWIFNGDINAIDNALTGKIQIKNSGKLLLSTDGFSRLVDLFSAYNTWESLLNDLENKTLEDMANRLRKLELQDPECINYPRFSIHDDATAIYAEFESE